MDPHYGRPPGSVSRIRTRMSEVKKKQKRNQMGFGKEKKIVHVRYFTPWTLICILMYYMLIPTSGLNQVQKC